MYKHWQPSGTPRTLVWHKGYKRLDNIIAGRDELANSQCDLVKGRDSVKSLLLRNILCRLDHPFECRLLRGSQGVKWPAEEDIGV